MRFLCTIIEDFPPLPFFHFCFICTLLESWEREKGVEVCEKEGGRGRRRSRASPFESHKMLQIRKKILISPCPNSGLRGVTISSPTLKRALAWLIGFPGREVTFLVLCHRGLLGFLGGGRLGLSPISGLGLMLIGPWRCWRSSHSSGATLDHQTFSCLGGLIRVMLPRFAFLQLPLVAVV